MKRIILSMLLIAAIFTSLRAEYAGQYTGTLMIGGTEEEGGVVYEGNDVLLFPGSNDQSVNFVLPDFSFEGISLGDIVLIDVPVNEQGALSLSGYPLYMETLMTRVKIDIAEGSTVMADSMAIRLDIDVPDLMVLPVYFYGKLNKGNYQPRNPGFEGEWANVSLVGDKINVQGKEPEHWHSFITGSGSLIAAAANPKQLVESPEVRPGSRGQKSACLVSKLTLGVRANGNMTCGRINGGSMSATDSTLNYAYSDYSDPDFNLPFNGRPDSMVVWVKYKPADGNAANPANAANCSAVLHTSGYYQEPAANCVAQVAGAARQDVHAVEGNNWQRLAIPFTYTEETPEYALITFTTCAVPGGGSSAKNVGLDSLFVDDVEMIYNADLVSFTIDDNTVEWEHRAASSSLAWSDSTYSIQAEADGIGARTFIGYNAADTVVTVIVAGGDYAGNTKNYKTYLLGLDGKQPQPQIDPTPETGLQNILAKDCKVYSNGSTLFIESNGALSLPIYRVDGSLVRVQRILEGTNIVPNLPTGMYIVAGKKAIIY